MVSAMPRPSSISPGRSQPIVLDRLLRDIRQHRVGTAEGHHCHLREEDRDLAKHVGLAKRPQDGDNRHQPQHEPDAAGAQGTGHRRACVVGKNIAEEILGRRARPPCAGPCPPPTSNWRSPARPPKKPIKPAPKMMIGKGTSKKKMPMKAAAASPRMTLFLRERLPIRMTASRTIASTAAFRPKNSAATTPTLPKAA